VAPNQIEFSSSQISLPSASGRFITFSVDAAATACSLQPPLLRFYLRTAGGQEVPISSSAINPCADPGTQSTTVPIVQSGQSFNYDVFYGRYAANGSVLLTGTPSFGIVLRNESNTAGEGNDGAIDDIRVLDATPQLDKSFSPAIVPTGGSSTLTFTITNTSDLAAKNGWSLTDALPSGLSVAAAPNIVTTCPSGVVTAASGSTSVAVTGNLAAGMASCTASVSVTSDTAGAAYTNGPDNVTTVGLNPPGPATVDFETPALTIVKHAGTPTDVNGDGTTDTDDTIGYTFDVTNTGDVPLTGIGVTDAKVGAVTCPLSTLNPAASELCTADALYTVTDADVTAGAVDNTATAHGTPPSGATTTSSPSTTSTPAADPEPALTVVKSATPSGNATFTPGQVITYNFVVTNTGNVTMSDIVVDDSTFSGTGSLPDPTCQATTLAPGAQTLCTADYALTADDVDSGSVTNTATVTGTPPGTNTPTPPSPPSIVVVPTPEAPGITLTKTAAPTTVTAAGQTIDYSFLVTNTGNVSLSDIDAPEGAFTGSGSIGAVTCPEPTLLAGQFETCTATYTVTQADVDAGAPISNTATATGTTPSGAPVASAPSTANVEVTQTPALTLVKTADATAAAVGQTLTYSFLVTNSGNVTITDPTIDETSFSGSGALSAIDCPTGPIVLSPADDITCTATYTVTQDDVDSGSLTNTATVTGTPPAGTPPVSPPSTSIVTTSPAPAITVAKTADVTKITHAGQVVTYSFQVTNAGNVTITDPIVHEGAFNGHGTISPVVCPAEASTLAPAETVTCTATYTVVQADLTRGGRLSNTATVSGTLRGGDTITSDPSTATVASDPPGGLALTGSDLVLPAALIALVLLLVGGLIVIIRRRRAEGSA
jgi:uncharacterized repeat protein (TIGR01451 family)